MVKTRRHARAGILAGLVLLLLANTAHATFSASRVTVTTAATLIYTSAGNSASICVFNRGAASVYLGGSTVATTTGAELPAGAAWCAVLGNGDRIFGIVAANTEVVHVTKVE